MSNFKRPGHTRIDNDLIRNAPQLDPFDFRVYCLLASLHPSHPSYTYIQKCTGIGRMRICKAIKNLKNLGLIEYNRGNSKKMANQYSVSNKIAPTSIPQIPVDANQYATDTSTSIPDGLQLVSQTDSNKNKVIIPKEKEKLLKGWKPENPKDVRKMLNALTAKKSLE